MTWFKNHLPILIILFLTFVVHFAFFGYPKETVFDEVHFGKFISGYFTGEYFFDIHPPLAKLLLAGVGYLTGFKPGFSFEKIGEVFPDSSYLWLRLLPILAGALLPVIIYYICRYLRFSKASSLAGALFIVFENSLLTQSRFILLDPFLLFFGFSSILAYLAFLDYKKIKFLVSAIILATLAGSVKWTGLTFLGLIGLIEIIRFIQDRNIKKLPRFGLFLIAPILYFVIFSIHLKLLYKSGPGDAFMTAGFQADLVGNPNEKNSELKRPNLIQKVVELNKEMYRANSDLTATHPYSSRWHTWPFMVRPIYYWNEQIAPTAESEAKEARIYFIGNPFIWWLSSIAILYVILEIIPALRTIRRDKLKDWLKDHGIQLSIGGFYLINLLPFIGIKRVMFLYHYMTGLVIAIIALAYLLNQAKNKKRIALIFVFISTILFIFFAPLSYGLPLTNEAYDLRTWFSSWR